MTAFDKFDPFERRIATAIEEIAMSRTPDYLDDILQHTVRTSQRPRWTFLERWTRVNRLTIAAAGATLAAVVAIGVLMNFRPVNGPGTSPSPSPSLTSAPEATKEAVVAAPEEIWGDWIADVDGLPEIDMPAGMIQLSVDWQDGKRVWLQTTPDYRQLLSSSALLANAGELRIRSNAAENQCPDGSEGRYQWSRSPDGEFLTLTLIEDACSDRAAVFARTWVRSLGAVNDGGLGVIYGVSPMVQVALPRGQRVAAGSGDGWQEIMTFGDAQPFQAFVVIANPGGFGDPCSTTDPQKIDIAPTTADFIAYLQGLPHVSVTPAATEIDGRAAIRFDYSIDDLAGCESGDIQVLHPQDPVESQTWTSVAGELQRMYIVQMDPTTTFLLWYQGNSETEQQVIGSIRFIDPLPTP